MSAEAQKPIEDDDQEIIIEQEEEVSDDVEETASSAPETEPDDNTEELESYSKGVQKRISRLTENSARRSVTAKRLFAWPSNCSKRNKT